MIFSGKDSLGLVLKDKNNIKIRGKKVECKQAILRQEMSERKEGIQSFKEPNFSQNAHQAK